jgi:predicted 2-oxoglutarate/Fe(II)-dependent dioxygenase YbiX
MGRPDGSGVTIDARLRALGVFARSGVFDTAACANVRAAMDRGEAEAARIHVNGYVVDERIRRTLDITIDSATVAMVERAFADLRPDVADFFGEALSAAEGPGFLRYPTRGFYRAHRDCLDEPGQEFPRRVSLVLFLTDADRGAGDGHCAGGCLRLYGVAEPARETVPLDISPVAGTLIGFRSHLLHEVLPVTGGVRDAIVDWFY